MKKDRRDFLKTMAAVPLAAGMASAFGSAHEMQTPTAKHYLRLWLEGPFGLIVNATDVTAWTPKFTNHLYMGGSTLLSSPPYNFSFKEAMPKQSALDLDPIFKEFEIKKVKAPGKAAMRFTLPMPSKIEVGCYRKVDVKRGGAPMQQSMPANFILVYEITDEQYNDKLRLALVDPRISILPVNILGKDDLQIVMQAGVPMGQGSDAHAIAVMDQLVRDAGSGPTTLKVEKILQKEATCKDSGNSAAKTPGMMMYFSTAVDCTAGGLPGCNNNPDCN